MKILVFLTAAVIGGGALITGCSGTDDPRLPVRSPVVMTPGWAPEVGKASWYLCWDVPDQNGRWHTLVGLPHQMPPWPLYRNARGPDDCRADLPG